MPPKKWGARLTPLRSLMLFVFFCEQGCELHAGQVSDRLERLSESIRPLLKAAQNAEILSMRIETDAERVSRAFSAGSTQKFHYFRLTENGAAIAAKAALEAPPELRDEMDRLGIRLDRCRDSTENILFGDDARLILLMFLENRERQLIRQGIMSTLGLAPDRVHVILNRFKRMHWIAAEYTDISGLSGFPSEPNRYPRGYAYRITANGIEHASQIYPTASLTLRVRAHYLNIEIPNSEIDFDAVYSPAGCAVANQPIMGMDS